MVKEERRKERYLSLQIPSGYKVSNPSSTSHSPHHPTNMIMKTEVYKNRSISGCIKTALLLFITHISAIFKALWMPAVACSAILGTLLYCVGETFTTAKDLTTFPIHIAALLVVSIACFIWFQASLLAYLNSLSKTTNLLKAAVIFLFHFLFVAFTATILYFSPKGVDFLASLLPVNPIIKTVISGIIFIYLPLLIGLFYITWIQPLHHYAMTQKEAFFIVIKQQYAAGLQHIGFWMGVSFLAGLLYMLVQWLMAMPINILLLAKLQSLNGELMGDPSGLPTYFNIMTWVVMVLVTFISLFAITWLHLVFYLAYGSIVTKMEGRKRIKQRYEQVKNSIN